MKNAITVSIKDKMNRDISTVNISDTLHHAASIMVNKQIGALVVVDKEEPMGMLTERDILKAYVDETVNHKETSVKLYMSSPLISIQENASLGEAVQLMLTRKIRRLGVINDDGKIVGFCNIRDLIQGVHESFLSLFEA